MSEKSLLQIRVLVESIWKDRAKEGDGPVDENVRTNQFIFLSTSRSNSFEGSQEYYLLRLNTFDDR